MKKLCACSGMLLVGLLLSGCADIVKWTKRNDYQTRTVRGATYNIPFKDLWPVALSSFLSGYSIQGDSESQGRIESTWVNQSTVKSKEMQQQLVVQILGREQPYRVTAVVHTKTREQEKNGQWSEWVAGQDDWRAVEYLTLVYESINGPIQYPKELQ